VGLRKGWWFDTECEEVTTERHRVYQTMIQRSKTRNLMEEFCKMRRIEKWVQRKKKREWMNKEFQGMEHLNILHLSRKFYNKIN
jgi:hypothetical protein